MSLSCHIEISKASTRHLREETSELLLESCCWILIYMAKPINECINTNVCDF